MKKFIILSSLSFAILSQSCKKDDTHHAQDIEIQWLTPGSNTHYTEGDTVHMKAQILTSSALHGWEINLNYKGNQVFSNDSHDHAAEFHIHETYIVPIGDTGHYEGTLLVTKSHNDAPIEKTFSFHVH